jgi:branched-chain amino acid transport system ATP-binding protein
MNRKRRKMSLLKLDNLKINYGKVNVIRGISMEVSEGSVVCLIGPNGAGKTTILKSIIGLVNINKGSILYKGEKINEIDAPARVKKGISLCPEGRRIFPEMTVSENLKLGAFLRANKSKIDRDLERIYDTFPILAKRRKQGAGKLSGGEQQMLAIGRALMSDPALFLLDEPSLGLAPIMVQTIWEIISDLVTKGMTFVLVEQNAKMALRISDSGYVLENGSIVLAGKSDDLLQNKSLREAYLGE